MFLLRRIEMAAGARETGSLTLADRMDVDRVQSWSQAPDVYTNQNTAGRLTKRGHTHGDAISVL
jgi:hypothetical protein